MPLNAFFRSDTRSYTLTFTRDDVAIDITGATVYLTMKKLTNDDDDKAGNIFKTQTTHSDPTNGITIVSLSIADTTVDPQTYQFAVKLIESDETTTTFTQTTVEIKDNPIQST